MTSADKRQVAPKEMSFPAHRLPASSSVDNFSIGLQLPDAQKKSIQISRLKDVIVCPSFHDLEKEGL